MATTANAFSAWRYAKCRDDAGTEHPLLTSPTWWLSGFEPGRVVRIVRLQVRHRCESAVRDSEKFCFQKSSMSLIANNANRSISPLSVPPTVPVGCGALGRRPLRPTKTRACRSKAGPQPRTYGRALPAELTAEGRSLLARAERAVQTVDEHVLAGLTPTQQRQLKSLLAEAVSNQHTQRRCTPPPTA